MINYLIAYTIFCVSIGFLAAFIPLMVKLIKERNKSLRHSFLVRCRFVQQNDGDWGFKVDRVFNEPKLGFEVEEQILRRKR